MDPEHLKKMDGSSVLWMAIQLSGVKRREVEKAQDWARGTVDRWVSSKDPHLPNMDDLCELIVMTMCGQPAENHPIIQWLIARANDGALLYDVPPITPDELAKLFLEFSADFGATAISAFDAVKDQQIVRVEALRMNKALMDIISTAQQIQQGLTAYI
jgi:hypothetical protein